LTQFPLKAFPLFISFLLIRTDWAWIPGSGIDRKQSAESIQVPDFWIELIITDAALQGNPAMHPQR
jgi:hypothetical protein